MSSPLQSLSFVAIVALIVIVALGLTACVVFVGGTLAQRAESQRPCPECGAQALRWVTFLRATVLVDGRRAPDSWSLHECEACGVRLKDHRGTWEVPSESDGRHFEAKE